MTGKKTLTCQISYSLNNCKEVLLVHHSSLNSWLKGIAEARRIRQYGLRGAFAVSDDMFYMEYNFKLFRWKHGDTEWYDTEQEETVELTWT